MQNILILFISYIRHEDFLCSSALPPGFWNGLDCRELHFFFGKHFFFIFFRWIFEIFKDFFWFFSSFLKKKKIFFLWIFFKTFLDFFQFFLTFFFNFLDFLDFSRLFKNFGFFLDFFSFFGIPFKVTKVTTKSYQGYYWAPKLAKNGPKQHIIKLSFFAPKKSLGQRPKPSAGARSRPA